jgi:hypothetical protein
MTGKIINTFQFYGYALIQILIEPKRFFTELPDNASTVKSLGFCILCGLFYTGASLLTVSHTDPAWNGAVFFLGNVGMIFVCASVSYAIMMLIIGRKTGFKQIFSIHAFSSGFILLVSWVSFFFWFTEAWKWWLVYIGFRNAGRLSRKSAGLTLVVTMAGYFFLSFYLHPVFFRP